MSILFISYRRSDSQDVTGRIYDRLLAKFTEKQVFKDVDSIPMGVSFPLHIKQMLGKARAVLVIIGPNWLHAKDEQGNPRLEQPNDYVSLEIEIALGAAVPVIPVLVSNARMPLASELPRSIQQLVRRNGMAVRPDPDFNNDIVRLLSELDRLEKLVTAQPAKPLQVKSPSPRSATAERAAAISAEPLPLIRPTAIDGSAAVDRARQHAAAGGTPVSGARQSRNRFVLPLAGLFLLIAGAVGLWAGGVIQLPTLEGIQHPQPFAGDGGRDDYDLTGGDRFVHFGPNGPRVVLTYNDKEPYFVQVYDLVTGKAVTPPLEHDGCVQKVKLSPDGKRVVTVFGGKTEYGYDSKYARVWDAATGEALTPPLKQTYRILDAAFSPDGKRVVTTGPYEARVWDAATGNEIGPFLHLDVFGDESTYSPDGKCVVTREHKTVRVWDPGTGKEIAPPLKHEDGVWHAFFSPDSKLIITTSKNTAWLWDAATGKEIAPPLKHEDSVWHALFSPDGKRVVTASKDKTARVWDAATGQELTPPLKHEDSVWMANFSADGARVVTSSDKTARVWDAATGQALTPPLKHDEFVGNAVFSPDGKQVATRTRNSCRLWDAQTGQEQNKLTK
jgi:WD40 repeat protein